MASSLKGGGHICAPLDYKKSWECYLERQERQKERSKILIYQDKTKKQVALVVRNVCNTLGTFYVCWPLVLLLLLLDSLPYVLCVQIKAHISQPSLTQVWHHNKHGTVCRSQTVGRLQIQIPPKCLAPKCFMWTTISEDGRGILPLRPPPQPPEQI